MANKEEIEAQLIELQNAKDEYLRNHREKALELKEQFNDAANQERAEQLRAQADAVEAGEEVPEDQQIGAN